MRIFFWNYVRFSNWQYSFLPFRDLWIVGPTTNQKALLGPVWRLSQFENKTEQVVYGCPNKDTCFLNSTLRNTVQMMNAFSRVYLTFELKITIHIWCQTKLMKFLLKMKWIKKEQNHASSWTMPSPGWILVTKVLLSSTACNFCERLRHLNIYSKIQSNGVTGIFQFWTVKSIRRFKLYTIFRLNSLGNTKFRNIKYMRNLLLGSCSLWFFSYFETKNFFEKP